MNGWKAKVLKSVGISGGPGRTTPGQWSSQTRRKKLGYDCVCVNHDPQDRAHPPGTGTGHDLDATQQQI